MEVLLPCSRCANYVSVAAPLIDTKTDKFYGTLNGGRMKMYFK